MDSFALMYGLRAWARQVQTHIGFYQWWAAMQSDLKSSNPRKEKQLADALEEGGPVGIDKSALAIVDFIGHELVAAIPCGDVLTNKQARAIFKNKYRTKSETGLASQIADVAGGLASKGLIDIEEPDSRKAGRAIVNYRKRSWAHVFGSDDALAEATRLLLTAENFNA